jgi:YjgF/chorismate_mutase-like, putative endoribonuclease
MGGDIERGSFASAAPNSRRLLRRRPTTCPSSSRAITVLRRPTAELGRRDPAYGAASARKSRSRMDKPRLGFESFTDQPKVANGASDLMVEIFGDAGRHARSAVGVNVLPLGVAVEIDDIFEIEAPST